MRHQLMQKPYEKAWGATQSIIEPSAKGKKNYQDSMRLLTDHQQCKGGVYRPLIL